MRGRRGWLRGYNAQVAVSDDHLVVACDVTSRVNDHAQLEPMIARTQTQLPDHHDVEFLADGGYWNGQVVERLLADGERVLAPPNGRPRTRGAGGSPTVTG